MVMALKHRERNTMKRLLLAAAAAVSFAAPASAQGAGCGDRDVFVQMLTERFGETRQIYGITTRQGALLELFASTDTGSWSVLITTPGGPTCLVSDGMSFGREDAEPVPAGDPA